GADEAVALRRHLLADQARLAAEDGLVMTIHPAVARNHSDWVFEKFGPDVGFDIPVAVDYVHHLRPMLNDVGHAPNFRTVLFTIDETVFSREHGGVHAGQRRDLAGEHGLVDRRTRC